VQSHAWHALNLFSGDERARDLVRGDLIDGPANGILMDSEVHAMFAESPDGYLEPSVCLKLSISVNHEGRPLQLRLQRIYLENTIPPIPWNGNNTLHRSRGRQLSGSEPSCLSTRRGARGRRESTGSITPFDMASQSCC
jgi:hypothetical protein